MDFSNMDFSLSLFLVLGSILCAYMAVKMLVSIFRFFYRHRIFTTFFFVGIAFGLLLYPAQTIEGLISFIGVSYFVYCSASFFHLLRTMDWNMPYTDDDNTPKAQPLGDQYYRGGYHINIARSNGTEGGLKF